MRILTPLLLAASLAALAAPALAQQRVGPDGTNANGPITIFKNMAPESGGLVVRVDGHEVDHLRSAVYDDITTTVSRGTNTLTVSWTHPIQRLNFKVAFAPTRNNFRNVLVVQANSANDPSLSQPGSKTLTFRIPG
ncbi:MAG: hypothetical protein ABSD03_07685 [Vulcanimicrobiaceae bacterium]|jgi:hypothetical protein